MSGSVGWRGARGAMATAMATVIAAVAILTGGCTSSGSGSAPEGGAATSTASDASSGAVLFSPEGNNLWAYTASTPFRSQLVNRANHSFNGAPSDPAGWDINGQVCSFARDGKQYLVTGEDTHQPDPPAGWAVWELQGEGVGDLSITRVARLVPTYQPTPDGPDNYGCGVLSDGRILTTDIGNTASGEPNGQLIVWFPPFDTATTAYCKIDLKVATGQAIYVDDDDQVYLNSPRPSDDPEATAGGIWKYSGPFPTGPDAAGGCGRTDTLGSPLADHFDKQKVLSSGEHDLVSPSGLTRAPDGHWFVASVINGVINEYDASWSFVRTVLHPPAGESLGAEPFSTGTPLGLAAGPDGSLFYADIGIVNDPAEGIGPGTRTGSVRRITFTDGSPNAPETVAADLQFPDGLGLWTPP